MPHPYSIVTDEDGRRTLTIFAGAHVIVAHGDHPNYDAMIEAAIAEASVDEVLDLHDISLAIGRQFRHLSERVSVAGGRLYFDGDEVDDSITRHILRSLDEDTEDFKPLVAFMENLAANPVAHSREQAYDWLRARDFTITLDGTIVAYKGVRLATDDQGGFLSQHAGPAIVNGVEHTDGQVRQNVGDVVELPRSAVAHDPSAACSVGLHVGTYDYARGYASGGSLLKVLVNPRDIVSVPTADSGDKIRVCRYRIIGADAAEETAAILPTYDDEPVCPECGDAEDVEDGWCDYCERAV